LSARAIPVPRSSTRLPSSVCAARIAASSRTGPASASTARNRALSASDTAACASTRAAGGSGTWQRLTTRVPPRAYERLLGPPAGGAGGVNRRR
jgi:hypothetical protein